MCYLSYYLPRFSGHTGVVRSLYVHRDVMVTLCSDRNMRFFDTKVKQLLSSWAPISCKKCFCIQTSRLLRKPKPLSALPLYACPAYSGSNAKHGSKTVIYAGCEDGTVMRVQFPQIQSDPLPSNLTDVNSTSCSSPINANGKSAVPVISLVGKFCCKVRFHVLLLRSFCKLIQANF